MNEYEIVEYFPNQWATLTGREARVAFNTLMADRAARVGQLGWLAELTLDGSDESLLALDAWFVDHVEPSPLNPVIPDALWRSVCRDVGIYAGEVIIERSPWLRWELRMTGPTFADYREPVIRGFTKTTVPGYEVGPCGVMFGHGCDALNVERVTRVDIGGGRMHEVQLGPVSRDTILGVVCSAVGYA